MEKKVFRVNGMKCAHCKANVENAIKSLNGVNSAVADLKENSVMVEYDAGSVKIEDLKKAVEEFGRYELEL